MRKYEVMFVVRPDLEEKIIKTEAENMKKIFTDMNVKTIDLKEMGQRELAYEVKGYKTGYYFLITLETDNADTVKEFDRVALISENVIRHLIVKVEE